MKLPDNEDSMSVIGEGDSHDGCIRVGKGYQAVIPNFVAEDDRQIFDRQKVERALLVWSPPNELTSDKIDEYIDMAKQRYGYNSEQALGMLFWHKHDLDKAVRDLPNFTPFPDDWSLEDRFLFEQAFQFHGKSFRRIRQMLPDKTIAQLVKYYYGWKKSRTRSSVMDRKVALLRQSRESKSAIQDKVETKSDGIEQVADSAEDKRAEVETHVTETNGTTRSRRILTKPDKLIEFDDLEMPIKEKPHCFVCLIECNMVHSTNKGDMCGTCHQHFVKTGAVRSLNGPGGQTQQRKDTVASHKLKVHQQNHKKSEGTDHGAPKPSSLDPSLRVDGIYVNHDDLLTLASGRNSCNMKAFEELDQEIMACKRTVQNNKQALDVMTSSSSVGSVQVSSAIQDAMDECAVPSNKWTDGEVTLLIEGIKQSGRDFKTISNVIKSKSEMQVRNYFLANKSKNADLEMAMKAFSAESADDVTKT